MMFKNKGTAGRTGRANKKGALELSITGIVVLIIAIVVLSLIIAFVRNYFTEAGGLVGGQLQEIKSQLRENLQNTGELLIFNGGTEIAVKRGSPQQYYVGVRNTVSKTATACYRVGVWCMKAFDTAKNCEGVLGGRNKLLVGGVGYDDTGQLIDEPYPKWVSSINSELEIPANDVEVSPISIQIAGASPDTYLMEIRVYQEDVSLRNDDGGVDCATTSYTTTPWQSKRFHIVLT